VILVDRPGSVQSSIVIGQPGFQATDPDYISMLALNHVLGGAVSSRLNTNLREKHGYTYGVFSGLDVRRGAGAFQVQSEVRTSATDSALAEAIGEIRRVVTEPVPAAELQGAVNNLVSGFPNTVQSVQGLSGQLQNLIVWGCRWIFTRHTGNGSRGDARGRESSLRAASSLRTILWLLLPVICPRSRRRFGRGILGRSRCGIVMATEFDRANATERVQASVA